MHERISINPKVCHGEPCIKGTRIMVTNILAAIAEGLPMSEILQDFPGITTENVLACVAFANESKAKTANMNSKQLISTWVLEHI